MTSFNTDYNNTELLDQELNFEQLQEINGGIIPFFFAGAALAKLFAGGAAAASAVKGTAAAALAGAKAVTAGQVGAAVVTGAVSGAASVGMSKALGADMDNEVALA